MATTVEVSVDPAEFRRLRADLFAFDRELLGKLNSRIKRAVEPVRQEAEGRAALLGTLKNRRNPSNPQPSALAKQYLLGQKRIQVKVGGTQRSDTDAVVRLVQKNGAAALAEFAQNARTNAGRELVSRLASLGAPGRLAWSAMDRHEADILADVRDEIMRTEQEYSARLRSGTASGVLR